MAHLETEKSRGTVGAIVSGESSLHSLAKGAEIHMASRTKPLFLRGGECKGGQKGSRPLPGIEPCTSKKTTILCSIKLCSCHSWRSINTSSYRRQVRRGIGAAQHGYLSRARRGELKAWSARRGARTEGARSGARARNIRISLAVVIGQRRGIVRPSRGMRRWGGPSPPSPWHMAPSATGLLDSMNSHADRLRLRLRSRFGSRVVTTFEVVSQVSLFPR
mmetsp:Transcript_30648/g.90872  ORF Transcript_30648/g.90872 Transcript_30648/m.90872 type:complete len:219 (+) Transcript_30648:33-689(+)